MKTSLILLLISSASFAQTYEYAQIVQTQSGPVKNQAMFYFGAKYDSTAQYGGYSQLVDAMDLATKKGWEVISTYTSFIDTSHPGAGITVFVTLKRKRPILRRTSP